MKRLLLLACINIAIVAHAQKKISINSPDNRITISFQLTTKSPLYSVSYDGKSVINQSPLSLSFLASGDFSGNLMMGKSKTRKGEDKYELVIGKTKKVDEFYNELSIPLEAKAGPKVNLLFRAYNSGIAFRYEFPQQSNLDSLIITSENSSFNFSNDPNLLALLLPNYTSSHEGEYTSATISSLTSDTLIDMPALFQTKNGIYASITEAALLDYAGMYLMKEKGMLVSKLSPLPNQPNIKVRAALPHKSPWRVVLLSDRVGALIESNLITNLNEPCKIEDLSWIKPGKTTFPWWNGNVTPDTLNAPGNNFVTNQYYIDFCARNGIEYHSVVEYGLHQWYTDDGVGFQPGPHPDVTKPVPGLDMKEICDYAATKGVGVRVWVHWAALYPKLDTAFAVFEQWGLKGMMIDFMDRDDQEMVNIQEEMLQKAAKHKLHIQFHGAYKPTGLQRTYPNEFTREGTLNYEVNKWAKRVTPDHDLNIAFTRLLAGPTDYHLGGFRAVPDSLFKVQYTRPLMMGTRCHMLAMYIVLENCLGMVCDYPSAYEGEPGFELLKILPTNWEDTRVPSASLHNYLSVARRKGDDWFIGTINNHEAKEIKIPLRFLTNGSYTATIYTDGDDSAKNPNHLNSVQSVVTAKDIITIQLANGGGSVIHLQLK